MAAIDHHLVPPLQSSLIHNCFYPEAQCFNNERQRQCWEEGSDITAIILIVFPRLCRQSQSLSGQFSTGVYCVKFLPEVAEGGVMTALAAHFNTY